MQIYDESKNFISDSEIKATVDEIKSILKKSEPYREIFKLPALIDEFVGLYGNLLIGMQKPVKAAIKGARDRVFAEVEGKRCHDMLINKFIRQFGELNKKAEECNNVAALFSIKGEADAVKNNCLKEISEEEAKLIQAEAARLNKDGDSHSVPVAPVKKRKYISIKDIVDSVSWQLESEADVKKYLAELEKKLIAAIEDDTVVNIEF